MQAAVILLMREADKARAALAKAEAEGTPAPYLSAIRHNIRQYEAALEWVKWGDQQRKALARVQTLMEFGAHGREKRKT